MQTMKKIILASLFMAFAMISEAQVKTPAPSPSCTIEQKVGLTDVKIAYSRPGVKDRNVFAKDGLVPFGKKWRTGANAVTEVTISSDVTVEGQELAAGKYALMTTPDATSWGIHFYDYDGGYPGDYKELTPKLTVQAKPMNMGDVKIESFLITLDDLRNNSATMKIMWANTMVPIKMGFNTDAVVFDNIEKVMAGPSSNDYYNSARYYRETGKDLNKALEWMNKSIDKRGEEKFWMLRQKSLIQADLKDYKGAIKTAERSLELSKEAENMDYVKMNEESIASWKKMK